MLQTSFYHLQRLSCAVTDVNQSMKSTVVMPLLRWLLLTGDIRMVPVCVGSISRTSSNSPTNPEVPMKVMIKGFPKQFLPFPWHFFCVFCISNKGKAEQKGVLVEAAPAKGWASRREQSSFLHVEKRPLLCAFHFSGRNWCPWGISFLSRLGMSFPFPQLLGQASVMHQHILSSAPKVPCHALTKCCRGRSSHPSITLPAQESLTAPHTWP